MNATTDLGTSLIHKGHLLSLYLENNEDGRPQQTVVLYVLKDFNLSEVMADFYENYPGKKHYLKSEIVLPELVDHLITAGYVYRPEADMICFGTQGRPPSRMIDEYKYSKNPDEFLLSKIRDALNSRCNGIYAHRGSYINLMNPTYCPWVVRAAISVAGVHRGMLEIGVSPSDPGRVPMREDAPYIRNYLNEVLRTDFPDKSVEVTEVFAPGEDEIKINRLLENLCKS